jgi:copper oxidase (laccase) domain-containing protein
VKVYGFGIVHSQPDLNWTLKGVVESLKPLETHAHIFEALRGISYLTDVYAPSPSTFNSEVVRTEDLRGEDMRSINFGIRKNLYRGVGPLGKATNADGVSGLRPHDAYVMSSADCALLVVMCKGSVWAAHAGRNSLMDRTYIVTDGAKSSKRHMSVVDAIMEEIPPHDRKHAMVYIGFSISSGRHFQHPIDHPQFGHSNQKMLDWIAKYYFNQYDRQDADESFWISGEIDLSLIIQRQLLDWGVRAENITSDGICTYTNRDRYGKYQWHSQAREKDGSRNLVVAVRIS